MSHSSRDTRRTSHPTSNDPRPIILFDGVCNLCNGITHFVIRHDPAPGRFRFAAMQSKCGQQLLREHGLPTEDLDTFVMIDGERAQVRSTAALHVLRGLGLPWSLLYVLIVVPRPMRDVVYRWIARNRYRWFGKRESCMVPTPDIRSRFLE
jgi:predicted DCC family thiol-disulfide oxidoreductase YuxK